MNVNNNFDRLSFTFNIPDVDQIKFSDKLEEEYKNSKNDPGCEFTCVKSKYKKKRRYKNNYSFTFNVYKKDTNKLKYSFEVYVSSIPINDYHNIINRLKRSNYIRVEFNPNKARKKGICILYKFLQHLIGEGECKKIYDNCRVTKVDMCIDTYSKINFLYPYSPRVRYYESKFNGGKFTGIILGSKKSKYRITFYDKAEELKAKKKKVTHKNYWRLEISAKDCGCSLRDLNPDIFKNKLLKIEFFNKNFLKDDYFCKDFIDNVKIEGINLALSRLDKKIGRQYLLKLRNLYTTKSPFHIKGINTTGFLDVLDLFKKLSNSQ